MYLSFVASLLLVSASAMVCRSFSPFICIYSNDKSQRNEAFLLRRDFFQPSIPPDSMSSTASEVTASESTGKLLHHFDQSDLDFSQWIDHMLQSGQLIAPDTEEFALIPADDNGEDWLVSLRNIGCSTLSGGKDLLDRAEHHFCDEFVQRAEKVLAKQMELDVTRQLCDNGKFCKLGLRAFFDMFEVFQEPKEFTTICHEMFDSLQTACPGGGGVAEAEVTIGDKRTVYYGRIESAYSLNTGFKCRNDLTHECFDRDIP